MSENPMSIGASHVANREAWAYLAYSQLRTIIPALSPAPTKALITYGFPYTPNARGECWNLKAYPGASPELVEAAEVAIFLHPREWASSVEFLTVLVHEMIHATGALGHGDDYGQVAEQVGLTASEGGLYDKPGQKLAFQLIDLAAELPDFPRSDFHVAPVDQAIGFVCSGGHNGPPAPPKKQPKQTNRQMLFMCRCGLRIRAARPTANALCTLCNTTYDAQPNGKEEKLLKAYGATDKTIKELQGK